MHIKIYVVASHRTIGTSFDTNWYFFLNSRTRAAAVTWLCDATKCIIRRAHVGFLSKVFVKSDLKSEHITGSIRAVYQFKIL